jgi:hypothetical protein
MKYEVRLTRLQPSQPVSFRAANASAWRVGTEAHPTRPHPQNLVCRLLRLLANVPTGGACGVARRTAIGRRRVEKEKVGTHSGAALLER